MQNSDIQSQFFRFYRSYLNKAAKTIKEGKAGVFVGIYGNSKDLLGKTIASNRFKQTYLNNAPVYFVYLNLKDKPALIKDQLYSFWLSQTAATLNKKISTPKTLNHFDFYASLSKIIAAVPQNEKICFIIINSERIYQLDENFFDLLINLCYYSFGKVSYLLFSEPQILDQNNPGLKRFLQRFSPKLTFLKEFDKKTTLADIYRVENLLQIDLRKSRSLILKYSERLDGMIQAFALFLKDNPRVKDIRSLRKILFNSHLYQSWIRRILTSLPSESLRILKLVCQNPAKFSKFQNSLYTKWLVDLNLLDKKGKLMHPLFLPGITKIEISPQKSKTSIIYRQNTFYLAGQKADLTQKEYLLLKLLYKKRGKTVTFDQINNYIWGNDPDNFSLWAISQLVKRLRRKLADYFLDPKIIHCQRKKGYLLIN